MADTIDQHTALTDGMRARDFITLGDYNFAYANRATFDGDAFVWKLRAEAGFLPDLIEGAAVQEYDPALGPGIGLLARMQDHGFVLDPGGYVAALAQSISGIWTARWCRPRCRILM